MRGSKFHRFSHTFWRIGPESYVFSWFCIINWQIGPKCYAFSSPRGRNVENRKTASGKSLSKNKSRVSKVLLCKNSVLRAQNIANGIWFKWICKTFWQAVTKSTPKRICMLAFIQKWFRLHEHNNVNLTLWNYICLLFVTGFMQSFVADCRWAWWNAHPARNKQ